MSILYLIFVFFYKTSAAIRHNITVLDQNGKKCVLYYPGKGKARFQLPENIEDKSSYELIFEQWDDSNDFESSIEIDVSYLVDKKSSNKLMPDSKKKSSNFKNENLRVDKNDDLSSELNVKNIPENLLNDNQTEVVSKKRDNFLADSNLKKQNNLLEEIDVDEGNKESNLAKQNFISPFMHRIFNSIYKKNYDPREIYFEENPFYLPRFYRIRQNKVFLYVKNQENSVLFGPYKNENNFKWLVQLTKDDKLIIKNKDGDRDLFIMSNFDNLGHYIHVAAKILPGKEKFFDLKLDEL